MSDRKTTERLPNPKKRIIKPNSLANLRRGGGRPAGVPNKVTIEAKLAFSEMVDDEEYRANFKARLLAGTLPPVLEQMAWFFAKGKPVDHVEVGRPGEFDKLSDADFHAALEASAEETQRALEALSVRAIAKKP